MLNRKGISSSALSVFIKLVNLILILLVVVVVVVVVVSQQVKCESSIEKKNSNQTINEPIQAANRIRNEPESVWVEFIQLALDYKPLNLGQGFPDFAAPTYLVESLQNATNQLDESSILNHQYTRSFGHPRLVRALRQYYQEMRNFTQLHDEREQILITVGAYEALFTAIMAFVNPGDEVLIVDPAFDAYAPMVAMAGGKSVFVPLRLNMSNLETTTTTTTTTTRNRLSTENYKLDMNELKSKLSEKTRVLVLNTPNNPMGKIYSRQELVELARVCREHNILVIADEVYEQFYYDKLSEHVSMASLPGMWERTITIGSAGKTFSVTGWKIGWAFGPAHLIRYMQLVHQTAVYTVATPLQEALARAFEYEMKQMRAKMTSSNNNGMGLYWDELRNQLRNNRERMARTLERAKMKPILPEGGYFMLADFSQLAQLYPEYKLDNTTSTRSSIMSNDYKFARWLSRVKHLQGIPGGAFYSQENKSLGSNLIRLCFIKSNETLTRFEQLIDKLLA